MSIKVRTQAQLDKALAKTNNGADELIACVGSGHFELRESSSAELRESSSAVLRESSSARAFGTGKIKAAENTVVMQHNTDAKITGGRILEMHTPTDAADWCEHYGVEVKRGIATLYKATGEDFKTRNGVHYSPGTKPEAPDWDPVPECGGGLHFSPSPKMAREFNRKPAHYVACPVKVSEIVVHPGGIYPAKVRAPRVCGPCVEVTVDGEPVA